MIVNSRVFAASLVLALLFSSFSDVNGQLVINELVQDNRTNGFSNIADTGEFIELYNSSGADLDLTGWTMNVINLDDGNTLLTFPLFGTIVASDPYYVIANASGSISPALIDFDTSTSDFLLNNNNLYEVRNPLGDLVDALGVQLTFDPQYDFVTTEQLAEIGGGGWSQLVTTEETPQSYGRYRDGEDTNRNGRDFGVIPSTPGASNNLPELGAPVLDISSVSIGSNVPGFSYSFVGPKVVDPTQVGTYIKHAIPASPQGGNAIVAWDNTGGGNMVASNSLVTSFDILAYIDTIDTAAVPPGIAKQIETTTYGIGTTDALYGTPDPTGELTTVQETSNGNTGVGWLFVKEDSLNFKKLFLIDFNDGGDSKPLDPDNPTPTAGDWTVLETIDLASSPSDWHRLSIDYDPATGDLEARFGNQVFNHTITTNMVGTFYVGFREPAASGVTNNAAPPIFQQFVASAGQPGDFDGDGDVDGRDFLIWQRGGTSPALDAGLLADWQANYGVGALSAVTAVPEPAAGLLIMALCASLSLTRIRQK